MTKRSNISPHGTPTVSRTLLVAHGFQRLISCAVAEYLTLHPEEAHELMVPSGFTQRLIRRYERWLSEQTYLSMRNGKREEVQAINEAFDALLPGIPKLLKNPSCHPQPSWRDINTYICRNGVDTVSGEAMAPEYEYCETGARVRVLRYKDMEGDLSPSLFL